MATFDDVRRIALALPDVDERVSRGHVQWRVNEKLFVWERPLGKKDIEWMGGRMRDAPILGARVEHVLAKDALLADDPDVFFTTPHFDGYPAILVWLDRIGEQALRETIVEAWLVRAPKKMADAYLAGRDE
jgi:hypothetical protein